MRYGLVLYGSLPVGKFTSLSISNQINDLYIDNEFVDFSTGCSNKELQFVIVDDIGSSIENKYVEVVENLGIGKFKGQPFVNEKISIYKVATFIKQVNKTLN